MKVPRKPISSPGRTEKFQPPLMLRFFRSNMGSKSRRSTIKLRANPMFTRKKDTVIETNQDPSSPKVSCIGQVKTLNHRRRDGRRCRHFWWFPRALFCQWKLRPISLRGLRHFWKKWALFFRSGYCKRIDVSENSPELSSNQRNHCRKTAIVYEQGRGEIEDGVEENRDEFVSNLPPKNAFILTRCRSAPYRSSSLANQFWESPLKTEEEEEEEERAGPRFCSSSRIEEEDKGSLGILQGRDSEGNCRRVEDGKPLMLTRCNSEPARTGEKLIIATISENKVGFC